MRRGNKAAWFLLAIFIFLMPFAGAEAWETLKTDHFTVFYQYPHEARARELLYTLEYYRPAYESLLGNELLNLPFILNDFGTVSNGITDPIFYKINLYSYPPTATDEISYSENWFAAVGIHEYVHMLHLRKTTGFNKFLVDLLGDPLNSNILSPGWIIEGITVYSESRYSPYTGRLNDGRYDAVMASRVSEGNFPSITEATFAPIQFPDYSGIYLFGGEFTQYLAKTYGEDKLEEFYSMYGRRVNAYASPALPGLGLDVFLFEIYGKDSKQLWKEWEEYERGRLADYRIDGEKITGGGWYIKDLKFHEGSIYYIRRYPVKTAPFETDWIYDIVRRDPVTGEEEVIISQTASIEGRLRFSGGKLYYAVLDLEKGYTVASSLGYGYQSSLYEYDLRAGETRFLFNDEIRSFIPDGKGNIIYSADRKHGFGSKLMEYNIETGEVHEVGRFGLLIDDIILYKGGYLVSAKSEWRNFSIYSIDRESGAVKPLVDSPYNEISPELSPDGGSFIFAMNQGGQYGIYRYNFNDGRITRLTEGGFAFIPTIDYGHSALYFLSINSNGYDIYSKKLEGEGITFIFDNSGMGNKNDSSAEKAEDKIPGKPDIYNPDLKITRGSYMDNVRTMLPGVLPVVLGKIEDDRPLIGLGYREQDALEENFYQAGIYWDYDDSEFKYDASFTTLIFSPISLSFSYENFDEERMGISFSLPLRRSIKNGLGNIYVGMGFDKIEDFVDRFEFEPYLYLDFKWPHFLGYAYVAVPFERYDMWSDIERTGIHGEFYLARLFEESRVELYAETYYDPDNPYVTFDNIRGYDDPPMAVNGVMFSAEYTTLLWHVREGFWNPNIYIEDIFGSLFVDAVFPEDAETQYSVGAEMHIEMKALFYVPIDFGLRFTINREGDAGVKFLIGIPLSF